MQNRNFFREKEHERLFQVEQQQCSAEDEDAEREMRARLGNLDGISDDWFPSDNQPHGDGLYSDNAYLRGTFLLVTGEDIKTKFEIVEGKIVSSVTALRNDFATERGYLASTAMR